MVLSNNQPVWCLMYCSWFDKVKQKIKTPKKTTCRCVRI